MSTEFVHSRWALRGYLLYSRLASLLMILVGLGSGVEWATHSDLVPALGGRDMRLTAAVCILLSLLHLGIRNIRLGPSLPACVTPAVLDVLVKTFAIGPITTPEQDLKAILKG